MLPSSIFGLPLWQISDNFSAIVPGAGIRYTSLENGGNEWREWRVDTMVRLFFLLFIVNLLANTGLRAQEAGKGEKLPTPLPPLPGLVTENAVLAVPTPLKIQQEALPPPLPVQSATNQPLPATSVGEAPVQPVRVSFLVSNVDEFAVIYERLVTTKGYPRGAGHVTAAAKMVNCLFSQTAEQKADLLDQVIQNLALGGEDNIRRRGISVETLRVGGIRNSAQAAQLAAVLACKLGDRKFENLILDFDAALSELSGRMGRAAVGGNVIFPFFQLLSVAELMN